MPRYRLQVEYHGGAFNGWQRQEEGRPSVQAALEEAAAALNGGVVPVIHGAGRTDAGVHATGQIAHLDLDRVIDGRNLRDAMNFRLHHVPVVVVEAAPVRDTFHARFSATARHYCYRILNRRGPAALDLGRVWHVSRLLDVDAMQRGADVLLGHHDFTSFRASECQAKSPMKTLDRLDIRRQGDEIHIHVSARSFLHNQVRIMVGTLRQVGDERWTPQDVAHALAARNRAAAGPTAPPDGLVLTGVDYDDWGD
jgi:tRNA pseudouridine38-40 synthase